MAAVFPTTSVTMIAKIKNLGPGEDSAQWVRFWNMYSLAIRQFAKRQERKRRRHRHAGSWQAR